MIVCIDCKQSKTVEEMLPAPRTKRGHYLYCRVCNGVRERRRAAERKAGAGRPVELRRKLPPYELLKQLYVKEGLTLSEIAARYDVSRSCVLDTIRRRAKAHGDPWPLIDSHDKQRQRRGISRRQVNPKLIIDLVYDYLEENGIFLKDFAERYGFAPGYLSEIKSGRYTTISKRYAVRLLNAIGEPVPEHLANWELPQKYRNYR